MRHLTLPVLLGLVALVPACKSSEEKIKKDETAKPEPTKTGTSGTRLKVRTVAADDGAKLQIGLYDSEREANCAFLTAADGVKRCLPSEAPYFNGTYWADPTCNKTPVAVFPKACDLPPIVLKQSGGVACAGSTSNVSVWTTSAGVAPSSVYSGTPTSCNQVSPDALLSFQLAKLGTEIPAADFVAGDETTE